MPNRHHPIIYIRGYAMSASERDETTADPFCGFNTGSTTYRAALNRNDPPRKFIFESPFVRLAADFDYQAVYEDGADILDGEWQPKHGSRGIPARSIIIYRFYDSGSTLLGDGQPREIEAYAKGLANLILRVRDLVCAHPANATTEATFKCHLVAHSMGGLVARAFLQNSKLGDAKARQAVDKFFTYATPHNGIDVAGNNVPRWLTMSETDTFNRRRMASYLALDAAYKKHARVDFMHESSFPIDNVFCMVGTNRADYDVGWGLSRTFVGHGSDGLVKIENAGIWGLDDDDQVTRTAAMAYAYRSHSGPFGIVNSEEAYQNLVRFLFGDVRVDIWLEVDDVTLPDELEGHDGVDALYQFELLARARGKRWYLSRRLAEEDSCACRTHKQLTDAATKAAASRIYLSTVFLAERARVPKVAGDRTMAYSMDLSVRVPDYMKGNTFWADEHYEGSYLLRDALVVTLAPPKGASDEWEVTMAWDSQRGRGATVHKMSAETIAKGQMRFSVPWPSSRGRKPGISGNVVLIASAWNAGWAGA